MDEAEEQIVPFADDSHRATAPNEDTLTPEAAGPFAFPDFIPTPANPIAYQGDPGFSAPPLRDQVASQTQDPAVAAELRLLRQIRDASLGSAAQLVVTEEAPPTVTEMDHPLPGVRRWLIPRVPVGGEIQVPAEEWVLVCPANRGRIGGQMTNRGAAGVTIAYSSLARLTPITGRDFLAAQGGSWDFRLADVLWSGAVIAIGRGGASIIEFTEL